MRSIAQGAREIAQATSLDSTKCGGPFSQSSFVRATELALLSRMHTLSVTATPGRAPGFYGSDTRKIRRSSMLRHFERAPRLALLLSCCAFCVTRAALAELTTRAVFVDRFDIFLNVYGKRTER